MERICTPKRFDLYRPLYRYMPLTYFLKLLKTNMFYVAYRKTFKDALESQLDIKLQFGFHAVGNNTQPPDKSHIQEDTNRITEKSKKHREFAELPTSCWTWQIASQHQSIATDMTACAQTLSTRETAVVIPLKTICF